MARVSIQQIMRTADQPTKPTCELYIAPLTMSCELTKYVTELEQLLSHNLIWILSLFVSNDW
jgi:hypothetical protein